MHRRACQAVLCLTLAAAAWAAQEPPAAPEPEEFLARDSHQGVTIAARPIPDTPEAEKVFGENAAPPRAGFLPVELLILNERDEPITVNLDRVEIFSNGERFEQADPEMIALALYPLPESVEPKVGTGPRLPVPWPRGPKVPKDKKRAKREEAEAALRNRQLRATRVAPTGRARGFLYFDLRGAAIDLAHAVVYLPEVDAVTSGEGLLFFEISLKAYAQP
jgi:hypothetical protein